MAINARAKSPPPSSPELLLEYLRELETRKGERHAVRIAVRRLQSLGNRPGYRRSVEQGFVELWESGYGELFQLDNDDLLFFYPPAEARLVNAELDRLRALFVDRRSIAGGTSGETWLSAYDGGTDYDRLVALAAAAVSSAPGGRGVHAAAGADAAALASPATPLTPETLARIETSLANADVSSLIRRHTVCRFEDDAQPSPTFAELTVSIDDLASAVMPGINLRTNDWLFDILTETLDRRMLALLTRPEEITAIGSISLNLNVATLISEEFLDFDAAMTGARRANVVIEVRDRDIFDNLETFVRARAMLQRKGYRFCLDGVGWRTFDLLDTGRLGVDFVKLNIDSAIDESAEHVNHRLRWLVTRAGVQRVILARIESVPALTLGREAEVALFQGRLIDKLLSEARRRGAAPPRG